MKLRYLNDSVLRDPTQLVEIHELEFVLSQIPEMTKIMNDEEGTGLAANQVGISKRFFIMKDNNQVKLIINPEIIELGPLTPFMEGCLSIPGTSAETQRAQRIKLKYRDERFSEIETEYNGLSAVAIQHEVDHLDGKLYIDQLPPMRKLLVVDKHRKFIKQARRKR